GVGASRVRDMFKTAKENSPCILFIDEIDAVGRVRGAGLGGGHDEREQILKVHTRNVPLALDVDLDKIARSTVGMSGADLANLVNEAALLATREDKQAVDAADLDAALDKVILGAKREEVITDKDKRATAYHEVGHALVGWLTPRSDPVHKVTIIPRGRALGVTQFMPEEDRISHNESQIKAKLYTLMGGRAAERLIYDDLSTGAAMDLEQATRLVRKMVAQWGMSERVGPVSFKSMSEHPFLGREMSEPRDHSEYMQQIIDEEVARILREADEHAYRLLDEHRDELERLTESLIEREVLTEPEIAALIGKRESANGQEAVSRAHTNPVVAAAEKPS